MYKYYCFACPRNTGIFEWIIIEANNKLDAEEKFNLEYPNYLNKILSDFEYNRLFK